MSQRAPVFHVARGPGPAIAPGALAGAVVAIGNFDGVHRGHQQVIRQLKRVAAEASSIGSNPMRAL